MRCPTQHDLRRSRSVTPRVERSDRVRDPVGRRVRRHSNPRARCRKRRQVRLPRHRAGRCATVGVAAALSRQPRQLGSRARRCARPQPQGDPVRQPRRRRLEREDTEHRRADGARRDRLHRCARARRGRSARILARQLRGPGDRSRSSRDRASPRARLVRSPGGQWHARLGARGDRSARQAGDVSRRVPRRLLHRLRAGERDSRSPAASSARARSAATLRPAGRPGWLSTTPYAPGDSPTTRYCSGCQRSTRRSSSPTATATR
jgi:hypothetical protein